MEQSQAKGVILTECQVSKVRKGPFWYSQLEFVCHMEDIAGGGKHGLRLYRAINIAMSMVC